MKKLERFKQYQVVNSHEFEDAPENYIGNGDPVGYTLICSTCGLITNKWKTYVMGVHAEGWSDEHHCEYRIINNVLM